MDKELKDMLDGLNKSVARSADGDSVKTAATTPAVDPASVEKGFTAKDLDEEFVDPLRKTFERLAKSAPSHFGALGATKTLDDPYGFLRQKNADGTYMISNSQLEAILVGAAMVNGDTIEQKRANGAQFLGEWAEKSGSQVDSVLTGLETGVQKGSFGGANIAMKAALDSSSGAALIRTDLEPMLHEAFLRTFPGVDAIPKIPANGLLHTWVQQTALGAASVVSELGSLSATEVNGTYTQQQSTNIAVIASQRSVGLKAQFASQQSGMNFGLAGNRNTEVLSGIRAISKTLQGLIFQGNQNSGASGAVADDEDGLYNANGLTGLRQQLKGGSDSITKSDAETYLGVLRRAVGQLINAGADQSSIMMFLSVGAQIAIDSELEQFFTMPKGTEGTPFPTNTGNAGLRMLQDILIRSKVIPAGAQTEGVGYYTLSATAREDLYLMDPEGIKLPYLGSATPVILELPTGYDNRLANTFIPFIMMGLALYVKSFNKKVRIAKQTV